MTTVFVECESLGGNQFGSLNEKKDPSTASFSLSYAGDLTQMFIYSRISLLSHPPFEKNSYEVYIAATLWTNPE